MIRAVKTKTTSTSTYNIEQLTTQIGWQVPENEVVAKSTSNFPILVGSEAKEGGRRRWNNPLPRPLTLFYTRIDIASKITTTTSPYLLPLILLQSCLWSWNIFSLLSLFMEWKYGLFLIDKSYIMNFIYQGCIDQFKESYRDK